MELGIEILSKEIERREILLAVENNVLIQNDMSNEIKSLRLAVELLAI
tara:strand:- start:1416 stop:1559 length:144 start_codon:yes stop_codon:yes gene_type:complete